MTQATLVENQVLTPATDASTSSAASSGQTPLRAAVREFLQHYFLKLQQPQSTSLYEQILAEMEIPLLEIVLQYCNQNQSQAAKLLNISRGNLRQKMKQYELLPIRRKERKTR